MKVSKLSYDELCKYIGHNVLMRSNCEFFPNFNIMGRVLDISIGTNNEYEIKVKTKPTGKELLVGSNMKNLTIIKL